MSKKQLWTQEFMGMGLSNFFQYMTQYMLITTLPIFIMDSLSGGEFEVGLAMTFFQIGTVCCRPFAGKWIDSYNKRILMLLATGIFLLVTLFFNMVSSLPFLFALRLLHGAVFAFGTTVAAALVVMVLPLERKGEGIGYFAVFSNLAMVIGPFIGLLMIMKFGSTALFVSVTILGILTFWVSNRKKLPDSIVLPVKQKKTGFQFANFIEKSAVPMAFFGGLVFFSYAGILVFIPLFMKELGMQEQTSMFFSVFALIIVLTRPFVGRIFDRIGENAIIYPGFVLFALGLFILGNAHDVTRLFVAALFLGCGFGALSPAFQTMAIQSSPPGRAGVATATYFWALDISVGLGSFLLSLVAGLSGYRIMYMVTAVVIIFTAVLYYGLSRNWKGSGATEANIAREN